VPPVGDATPFEEVDKCSEVYHDMLAEYDRIVMGKVRRGFVAYGSGGNSMIDGCTAPSPDSVVGGNSGWFEHSQRMNKQNIAISEAASDERIVVAAISGAYFPKDRYCNLLVDQLGLDTEQLAYLGPYHVHDEGVDYDKNNV
jgi:hypothetical protein